MIRMLPFGGILPDDLIAPPGTRMPFHQAATPAGWTQEVGAAYNDTMCRANNSSPTTGGSTAFTSFLASNTLSFNSFNLTVAQLPAHNHTSNDPTHSHGTISQGGPFESYATTAGGSLNGPGSGTQGVQNSNFGPNDAGLSTQNTGSGTAITPNMTTPAVKYLTFIIGIKQ